MLPRGGESPGKLEGLAGFGIGIDKKRASWNEVKVSNKLAKGWKARRRITLSQGSDAS